MSRFRNDTSEVNMTRPTPHGTQITAARTSSRVSPGGRHAARFPTPRRLHSLSAQEVEILKKVASGLRDSDIAADLFIQETTARAVITRLRDKTGSRSRLQLVIYAYEQGYVKPAYLDQI